MSKAPFTIKNTVLNVKWPSLYNTVKVTGNNEDHEELILFLESRQCAGRPIKNSNFYSDGTLYVVMESEKGEC